MLHHHVNCVFEGPNKVHLILEKGGAEGGLVDDQYSLDHLCDNSNRAMSSPKIGLSHASVSWENN